MKITRLQFCQMKTNRFTSRLLILALMASGLCMLAAPSAAAVTCTYYVSPTGSDSASGTSTTSPWQTVQKAFNTAQAGQTVCFMAGVYPINTTEVNSTGGFQSNGSTQGGYSQVCCTNSGTSASPIIFTNYECPSSCNSSGAPYYETAIIQGATKVTASFVEFEGFPIETVRAPGLIFEGPTETQEGLIDVFDGAHDVTFDHVEIRNGDFHAGFYVEADGSGGYNINLLDSYIHDNGRWGEYNATVSGAEPVNVDQGVYVYSASSTGTCVIANNIIKHNVSFGIQLDGGSISNVKIEENTIVDNGNSGIGLLNSTGSGNVVANNILAYNGEAANNPQLRNQGAGTTITNNLFWDPNATYATCWNGTTFGTQYCGSNFVNQDPLFTVTPGTDAVSGSSEMNTQGYYLSNTSPAIGAGTSTYTQTVDKDGLTRSSPPDLGAFEN